ncbi:MAG TPA: SMR family transporter [Candidatus Nanoarchaeia archaeon]|nr:SMR family transporter [Candidatus Nanoarchaeia archaeon]
MDILIIVLASILIGSLGQIALKYGMIRTKIVGTREIVKNLFKVFTNFYILLGIAIFAASSFVWLYSMTRLDISFMYPLVSIGYLFVTLFAIIFLKERVSLKRWAGLSLIIIGSLLIMVGV